MMHVVTCPHGCAFITRAVSEDAADRAMIEHNLYRHRVRECFKRAGVLRPDGTLVVDEHGMVHLPPIKAS